MGRARGTGGRAGRRPRGPALRAETARVTKSPLRPKQRANLRGPPCMGARANARTTPTEWAPCQPDPDPGTFARTIMARSRLTGCCGGQSPVTSGGVRALRSTSSLPGRPPL
ncbi:hypothetical protein V6Z77_010179 [Aspergillus fumigatus]